MNGLIQSKTTCLDTNQITTHWSNILPLPNLPIVWRCTHTNIHTHQCFFDKKFQAEQYGLMRMPIKWLYDLYQFLLKIALCYNWLKWHIFLFEPMIILAISMSKWLIKNTGTHMDIHSCYVCLPHIQAICRAYWNHSALNTTEDLHRSWFD